MAGLGSWRRGSLGSGSDHEDEVTDQQVEGENDDHDPQEDAANDKNHTSDSGLDKAFQGGLKLSSDHSDKEDEDDKSARSGDDNQEFNAILIDLKTAVGSMHFFPNWIVCATEEAFEKSGKTVLDVVSAKLYEIFNITDDDEEQHLKKGPDLSEIKYSALELLTGKLTQLYLSIRFGKDESKIDKLLQETVEFIGLCFDEPNNFIERKYRGGIDYVLNGLRAYAALELLSSGARDARSYPMKELKSIKASLKSWEELTDMEKAGVYSTEQYFIGSMDSTAYQPQLEVLEKIIALDPENPQWLFLKGLMHRYERKSIQILKPPTSIEIYTLVTAIKIDKTDNPQYAMARCNAMAEFLRHHYNERSWDSGVGWGCHRQFQNAESMVEFLQEETRRILTLCPMSVWANISVAEIYSKVLPWKYRDIKFAKLCCKRALLFHPNSSKANTRMAIISLVEDKKLPKAEKYLLHALEGDWRNFPALIELAQLYLSPEVDDSKTKLSDLLERELSNKHWPAARRAQLLMVKGLAALANGDQSIGVESWIKAYEVDTNVIEVPHFIDKMSMFTRRYLCPESFTDPRRLEQIFSKFLVRETVPETREILKQILKLIGKVITDNLEKEQRKFGGRGGRGGGGRGGSARGRGGGRGGFRGWGGNCSHDGGNYQGYSCGGHGSGDFSGFKFKGSGFGGSGAGGGARGPFHGFKDFPGGDGFSGFKDFPGSRGGDYDWREDYQKRSPKMGNIPTDSYELLGVKRGASSAEIRAAYYKLCLSTHPDKNPHLTGMEKEANLEKMKRINKAYESLQCK